MTRLVDADALIDDMCEDCGAIANGACDKDVCASVLWVKNAPTIEAEPVRHGRCDMCEIMESGHWIRLYKGNGWQVAIDRGVGGYELAISHFGEHFATKIDYCPYCGAKLDGGEKKNE